MKYIRQTDSGVTSQTMQDVCLICGVYMPEGMGMVCPYCASTAEELASGLRGEKAVQIG